VFFVRSSKRALVSTLVVHGLIVMENGMVIIFSKVFQNILFFLFSFFFCFFLFIFIHLFINSFLLGGSVYGIPFNTVIVTGLLDMREGKHTLHFLVGEELLPHTIVNIPKEKMHMGVC
jgi:hypothetical protein